MFESGLIDKKSSRRLAEINRAITTSLNFDEVLDLIVESAGQLVGAKVCALLLVDRDERLRIRAARGVDANVIRNFQGLMEEDVLNRLQQALKSRPEEHLVSTPVIDNQSLSGLLVVLRDNAISPDEQWELSALADQAAIALRNARLYELEMAEATRARDASDSVLKRLAAIIESSDDAIISKDLNGIIKSWNPGAERLFGYTEEEAVGQPINILIPHERHAEETSILERIRRGERIEHFETERVRKGGNLINISLAISPIRNQHGEVVGASKIARDITEQKEAQEQLRRALEFDETVMLSMGEGLYTVDDQGRVTFMNPAAQRMFGWTLEEVGGQKMHDLTHHSHPDGTPFPASECSGLAVLREGTPLTEFEDSFIRRDGTFFDVVYSSAPLRDGGRITGLVVVFRDISDRKQAEEERARLLAAERHARTEAENANRLKDEFLATLSHELRNPLSVVISYAEVLRRSTGPPKQEFVVKAAETIRRNALAQSQLVSDLLDLSRLQMGKLSLDRRPVSYSTIITDAIETVREAAAAKQIVLEANLAPEVLVVEEDPIRLAQIAWNLLNNAMKFTPAGGRVRVQLKRDEDFALLSVEDTGQGISAEFLPHVFEIFRQADASMARKQGGMGIGLALVEELVELHGGDASAESDGAGKGARFTVRIPLNKGGESALTSERTGATGALKKKFILVVDDSAETTEILGTLLEMEGASVELAQGGQEALELAARTKFDLVVSDISMPGMDGYQLLRSLRALPDMKDVPVIALTGFGRMTDVERARQEGFAEHLTKPLDLDKLLQIVTRLTNQAG